MTLGVDLARNATDVAHWYMAHKGFRDASLVETTKLQDVSCWYFYYVLDEGDVELEVHYGDDLTPRVRVTTYTPRVSSDPPVRQVDGRHDRREVPAGQYEARR